MCSATSRLLLHSSIAPRFLDALKRRAEAIQVRLGSWGVGWLAGWGVVRLVGLEVKVGAGRR